MSLSLDFLANPLLFNRLYYNLILLIFGGCQLLQAPRITWVVFVVASKVVNQ